MSDSQLEDLLKSAVIWLISWTCKRWMTCWMSSTKSKLLHLCQKLSGRRGIARVTTRHA